MKRIILTLGAPNDEQGNLSPMALDRLECTLGLYQHNDHVKILCTGGFGESFNTTNHPHAYYSRRFLMEQGVSEDVLLEPVLTTNTVEDFRMSKPIIEREKPDLLLVVTSDFHMRRVKLLHDLILKYPHVVFIPAKSSLSGEELAPLVLHEELAVKSLQERNFELY